jgi:hypothetical protein
MSKYRTRTRGLLAALIVSSSLASVAHANQGPEEATNYYRATTQVSRPMPAPPTAARAVAVPQFLTFPEGSPNYHGANGG